MLRKKSRLKSDLDKFMAMKPKNSVARMIQWLIRLTRENQLVWERLEPFEVYTADFKIKGGRLDIVAEVLRDDVFGYVVVNDVVMRGYGRVTIDAIRKYLERNKLGEYSAKNQARKKVDSARRVRESSTEIYKAEYVSQVFLKALEKSRSIKIR